MALPETLPIASFADLVRVASVSFVQSWQQQRSATGGGETRYADRAPSLWTAEVTSPPMEHAEAEALMALANSRAGGLKTVLLYNPKLPFPTSDPTGAMLDAGSILPAGAQSIDYDFTTGSYESEGMALSAGLAFTCVRASVGYAQNVAGQYFSFAANLPRITDRGLLVEPAKTNLVVRSWNTSAWSGVAVTYSDAPTEKSVTGNPATRVTRTAALSYGGPPGVNVTPGQVYTLSARGKIGSQGNGILVLGPQGGSPAGRAVALFNLATGQITYTGISGTSVSYVGSRISGQDADGMYLCELDFSATVSALTPYVGPSSTTNSTAWETGATVGDNIIVTDVQLETGPGATSRIPTNGASAGRAADVVTLDLPAGTHELALGYASGPVTVAAQTGSYVVPNSSSRTLEEVTAVKTSLSPASPAVPKLGVITDRLHVAFVGMPAGYVIPLGTYFGIMFDTSRYYLGQFVEARTANASGAVAAVEIWPPLPAMVSTGLDVVLKQPVAKFRLVPGSAYPSAASMLHSTFKFSAEQTYSR